MRLRPGGVVFRQMEKEVVHQHGNIYWAQTAGEGKCPLHFLVLLAGPIIKLARLINRRKKY